MQHDVLGYLVNAIDSSERDQIEQQLSVDENLRRQVDAGRRSLTRLSWDAEPYPAPAGLVERTCAYVEQQLEGDAVQPASKVRRVYPAEALSGESGGWTFADFVVAAGICVAAACLFFPAILNSRYNARLAQCQNNLRQLGVALQQYSDQNNGYFPTVPATGNLAFAGAYASLLRDKDLLGEDYAQLLSCPSRGGTIVIRIPRSADVNAAQGAMLVTLQKTIGGDYAYPLGYVQNGKLHGIRRTRNQQRAQYVILADAPLGDVHRNFRAVHDGGQNVLFEDGHAAFLATRFRPGVSHDDYFVNDLGYVEAGVHAQDNVLGSSSTPPFLIVRNVN
jgi:hypothetical protein